MQMNTLRMLPRARVNKQTNEQTKHLSVLEKRDLEKTKTRGEFWGHIRSRFWLTQKRSPSPFFTNEQKRFSSMIQTLNLVGKEEK